ncbi:Protein SAWADEE HOMEODOMAIN-like 2 [Glycine max]|nr:Protein SAWADEE HOMEODOMAIN-like 2 [Glycine max]
MILSCEIVPELIALQEKLCKTHQSWNLKQDHQKMEHDGLFKWYDVEAFLAHRFLSTGEAEVQVRFVGFGAEEDEWINIKTSVRQRSIPLESTECSNLKIGDPVLCFQERRDQAIYYDAHIVEIQKRMHDIRGCRCLLLIHYDHDNSEERVRLRRLCRRPRS